MTIKNNKIVKRWCIMQFSIECIDITEAYILRNAVCNYRADLINKFRPQLFEIFMKCFKDEMHKCNLLNDQCGLKIHADDYECVNIKFYAKSFGAHFTKIYNIDFTKKLIINEIHSLLSNNNLDFVVEMYHLNDNFVWVKIYFRCFK